MSLSPASMQRERHCFSTRSTTCWPAKELFYGAPPAANAWTGRSTLAGSSNVENCSRHEMTDGADNAAAAGHAFLAVMRRDLSVFLSYRARLISQALTSVFSL